MLGVKRVGAHRVYWQTHVTNTAGRIIVRDSETLPGGVAVGREDYHGKLYLTMTNAGLGFFQQAHWAVWTIDLADPSRLEQVAILFFLAGSVLCGLSQSMLQLIVFRALQGLGAAIMTPGNVAMVTDALTAGAFLPLMFWPGVSGEFMRYLPITVFAVLVGSLLQGLLAWK